MRKEQVILSQSLADLLEDKSSESRVIKIVVKTLRRFRPSVHYCRGCDQPFFAGNCGTPTCPQYKTSHSMGRRGRPTRILADRMIGDHFTFREKRGLISYMPRGKEQKFTEAGTWSLEGRQSVSPGKWLRSLFSDAAIKKLGIKDHEFAVLATALKYEELANELTFRLVSFEEAYEYGGREGAAYSCMKGKPVGEFYRLFGAECVACYDGNASLRGRAVLWNGVAMGSNTIQLMDRIYSDSPEIEEGFKTYARSKGWHHKLHQSRDSAKKVVCPDGDQNTVNMSVYTLNGRDVAADFYPYLDTFHSGDSSSLDNSDGGHYTYSSTDGSRESEDDHDGQVENVDGDWISEDDAVEVDGDWYEYNDRRIVYSEPEGCSILRCNAVLIKDDWYPDNHDDIVWCDATSRHILVEDAVCVGDEWYPLGHIDICECADGEWALREDCVEVDDEWYVKDDGEVRFLEDEDRWVLKDKVDPNQLTLTLVEEK